VGDHLLERLGAGPAERIEEPLRAAVSGAAEMTAS
jgi:hypothetical protein